MTDLDDLASKAEEVTRLENEATISTCLPALQADLDAHHSKMERLVLTLKTELLEAQKQQFQEAFGFLQLETSGYEMGESRSSQIMSETGGSGQCSRPRAAPSDDADLIVNSLAPHPVYDRTPPLSPRLPLGRKGTSLSLDGAVPPARHSRSKEKISFTSQEAAGSKELISEKTSSTRAVKFTSREIAQRTSVEDRTYLDGKDHSHEWDIAVASAFATRYHITKNRLRKIVKSPIFDIVCGIVICINVIIVGVETEFLAQTGEIPIACNVLQLTLNAWYLMELLLRLTAEGLKFFFGEDRNWNLFDAVLVLTAILDVFLSNISVKGFQTVRILRAVRFFRIIRTLRIVRQMKYVREFRKMVYSLMSSMQTLFWSILMVFGVMYSFALWFTQAAVYYGKEAGSSENVANINLYYSSLSRAFYTLFGAISGGYSWHVLLDPWIATNYYFSVIFFVIFILISVFGLLNIVTSVFVESAMHASRTFQDLLLDDKQKEIEMFTQHMLRIFKTINQDDGGSISFREMKVFLSDKDSELPQYLEALGITSSDVWVLFKLLDTDGSGKINITEFSEGCMRLKGEARSFDINCMMYENRAMLKYQSQFMEFVEEQFAYLETVLSQLVVDLDRRLTQRFTMLLCRRPAAADSRTAPHNLKSDSMVVSAI